MPTYEPRTLDIDETTLTHEERLGLAYCRLNGWEWDEYISPKPADFDSLPDWTPRPILWFMKRKKSKSTYITPAMIAIESIIGKANTSWYWWKFELGKTYDEWFKWYITERIVNYIG